MITAHFEEGYAAVSASEARMREALATLEDKLDRHVDTAAPGVHASPLPWILAFAAAAAFIFAALVKFQSTVRRLGGRLLTHSPVKRTQYFTE